MAHDTGTAIPPSSPHGADALAGTAYRVAGKGKLGEGGAGEVYEAVHIALGKPVVIKVLRRELADSAMYVERMRLEAQTLARLRHANITAVSDFGCTPAGRPFFVMERLAGRTLYDEVRERGCLPVDEAVELGQQLLAGLSAAHAIGVIHRDVKLENIFLCDPEIGRRTLKILDFGIAKVVPGAASAAAPKPLGIRSHEGVPMGTLRFLSPEQVLCNAVDERTDVYGAGMVLYELLAGRDPFHHVTGLVEIMEAHVSETPRPPSACAPQPIPPALDAVILHALAKRPEDRHASCAELSAALRRAVTSRPVRRSDRGLRMIAIAVVVVVATAALSALLAVLLSRALPVSSQPAEGARPWAR